MSLLQSTRLFSAIYNGDWVNRSLQYKKIMLLVMLNVQQELRVHVGGFIELSLQTLVLVKFCIKFW